MRLVLPLSLYCISLLCLQPDALPVGNRMDLKTILHQLRDGSAALPDSHPSSNEPTDAPAVSLDRTSLWRALLYKNPPPSSKASSSAPNPLNSVETSQRSPRGRRNTHYRGHHHQHGQLMRVGCVLGTCQVQNLSQRLYQLVGQTGRQESAPINPHSPHSYG